MTNFLALDASTEYCSCALLCGSQTYACGELAPRRHADLLLPMAEKLLSEAGIQAQQLDAVAFGQGPGSFTGLRIACGVAQGIALGVDISVLPISSLAMLAQAALEEYACEHVLSVLDARMGEVYWGAFTRNAHGVAVPLEAEQLSAPEALGVEHLKAFDWQATGTAWEAYPELAARLQQASGRVPSLRYTQAAAMLPLAQAAWQQGLSVSALEAVPVYLRNQVTHAR